jgi:hypothetical protein
MMSQPIPTDDLIEALANLEHEQWLHWSQAVAAEVPARTRQKWEGSWVNYGDLNEELKEADRIWARKVVALLQQYRVIK